MRRRSDFRLQDPVLFRLECLNEIVALHTEAESGDLTGPIGNELGVEVTVLLQQRSGLKPVVL